MQSERRWRSLATRHRDRKEREEKKLGELVVVTGKQSREAKAAGHAAACLYTIYKDYLYLDL